MILINDNYNGSSIWIIDKDQIERWSEIIISDRDFETIINVLDNNEEFHNGMKEMITTIVDELLKEKEITALFDTSEGSDDSDILENLQ